jgi:hypothetical protein
MQGGEQPTSSVLLCALRFTGGVGGDDDDYEDHD